MINFKNQKIVKCKECKHLLLAFDAQTILNPYTGAEYYCPTHRRHYDEVEYGDEKTPVYIKRFKVNEDGDII